MKPEIVLCVDSESAKNPELIGLGGENLLSQPWLRLFCSAVEARAYLREADAVKEAWVASSDEMDPINLAAALKKDAGATSVCLVTFGGGGSLKSRASAAGIDATLTGADFASRYSSAKSRQPGAPRLSRAGADRKPEAATVCESVGRSLDLPTVAYPAGSGDETVCPIQGNPGANRPLSASESVASETKGDACGDARKASLRKTAFLITVVSATGGAGKSTVAALSAFFAQGFGYKTLLVDADLQAGDMRRLVGEESPVAIDEVIAGRSEKARAIGVCGKRAFTRGRRREFAFRRHRCQHLVALGRIARPASRAFVARAVSGGSAPYVARFEQACSRDVLAVRHRDDAVHVRGEQVHEKRVDHVVRGDMFARRVSCGRIEGRRQGSRRAFGGGTSSRADRHPKRSVPEHGARSHRHSSR